MYEYRVVVDLGDKKYSVPIKWMSIYVRENTEYESLNEFMRIGSVEEKTSAINHAKKDKVCEVRQ